MFFPRCKRESASCTIEGLLAAFERAERLTGSQRYVRDKMSILRRFVAFARVEDPEDVEPRHVEEFMADMLHGDDRRKGRSPKTVANARACIGRFFHHLLVRGEVTANPARLTRPPKIPRTGPRYLTRQEVGVVFRAGRASGILPELAVAYYTGMRLGQLRALRWRDVQGQMVEIGADRPTKGNRPRSVRLHRKLARLLRRLPRGEPNELMFPAGHRRTWHRRVKPIQDALPGFTWHRLRHSFGSHLAQRGVRIQVIQRLMGHSSIQATMIYAHLAPEDGAEDIERL